jgi:toxin ParE1/3/4
MRLIVAEPAARDLGDIIDYIALDNPTAAERVYRAISASAARLRDFPNIGHAGRLPGTRELSIQALPYVMVYAADAETVTILAIFHTARDISRALRERTEP